MQGEVERALVVMGSTSPSGYLCNPGNAGTGYNWTAAIDAAAKHGAELTRVEVSKPDELHTAFNALKDRDALLVQWDFLLYPLRNRLAEVAAGDINRSAVSQAPRGALGMSGGAATALAYAVQHPNRVSKLVLYGGYALGRNKRRSPQTADEAKAFLTMIRSAWNDSQSPFWRAFSAARRPAGGQVARRSRGSVKTIF
jgi:pimeloyl-ACP methyl ester carboxylesterase